MIGQDLIQGGVDVAQVRPIGKVVLAKLPILGLEARIPGLKAVVGSSELAMFERLGAQRNRCGRASGKDGGKR